MRILIGGLSPQSIIATEVVAQSVWSDATFVHHARGNTLGVAMQSSDAVRCDICVVDLLGMGLGTRTDEAEIQLEIFLADRGAVLLVPAGSGGGWLDPTAPQGRIKSARTVLQRPVTVSALRDALRGAAGSPLKGKFADTPWDTTNADSTTRGRFSLFAPSASTGHRALTDASAAPPSLPSSSPAPVSEERNLPSAGLRAPNSPRSAGRHGAPQAPEYSAKSPQPPASPHPPGRRLADGGFDALRAACPEVASNKFLKVVLKLVISGVPYELLITPGTGAIFHPADGWVASNIRTEMLERFLKHEIMLQTMQARDLTPAAALELSEKFFGRREDGRRPLDTFLWSVAFGAFNDSPLIFVSDLHFQLHRYPNFTRLTQSYEVFMQMATICLRGPQSVVSLRRIFARSDPQQVALFVVCVLLCDMASVLPEAHTTRAEKSSFAVAFKPSRLRGVFKALLEKLF
ncbi:MAG: hypothetical protein ABL985_17395 [Casimicrobium sp.]